MSVRGSLVGSVKTVLYISAVAFCIVLWFQQTKGYSDDTDTSKMVQQFDWREVNGADNPGSPYYDGDENGSGWMTALAEQQCHHCWVFSVLNSMEAVINLYYNDHLDLDLSQQEVASCSGGGSTCEAGGSVEVALQYLTETGVSDEQWFEYSGDYAVCRDKDDPNNDPKPQWTVKLGGMSTIPKGDYDEVKRRLMQKGPFVGCVKKDFMKKAFEGILPQETIDAEITMDHCVAIVGFSQDPATGDVIWHYKDSKGEDNLAPIQDLPGYGALPPVPFDDVTTLVSLETPIEYTPIPESGPKPKIACRDEDGDGYYYWGISDQMPENCLTDNPLVSEIPLEKDCNDADPTKIFMNDNGHCLSVCSNDANCDDGDPCTVDYCSSIGCEHERIAGCGNCVSVEGTLDSLVISRYVEKRYEEDGCEAGDKYYAHGSEEYLGDDGQAEVTLNAIEGSFNWATTECTPSIPCNCDDGLFCNGVETCGPDGECLPGISPCGSTETCDEENDVCEPGDCPNGGLPAGERCLFDSQCCSGDCDGSLFSKKCQ